jgi:hypothetical protein
MEIYSEGFVHAANAHDVNYERRDRAGWKYLLLSGFLSEERCLPLEAISGCLVED